MLGIPPRAARAINCGMRFSSRAISIWIFWRRARVAEHPPMEYACCPVWIASSAVRKFCYRVSASPRGSKTNVTARRGHTLSGGTDIYLQE